MLAFLLTIADNALGFFTQKTLRHYFDSKKKSESTTQIDALVKIHNESLENAVKRKELEIELAQEQKDKALLQAELNELKNRQADPEKALQEEAEFKAKIKADLEREGNEAGAEKMAEAQDALKNGDFSKAIEFFTEIKKREELGEKRSARASFALGEIAKQEVRWKDAAEHYARAARLDPNFYTLIRAQKFSYAVGDYDSALSLGLEAQKAAITTYGEDSEQHANSLNNLAAFYQKNTQYKEAEQFLLKALKINKALFGENHASTAHTTKNLGSLYREQGRYEEAETLCRQALKIHTKLFGENDHYTADCLNHIGGIYQDQGQYEKSEPLFKQALKIYEDVLGDNHPETALTLNNLAAVYTAQGKYEKAEPFCKKALKVCKDILGHDHPTTESLKDNYEFIKECIANAENDEPQ